MSSEKRQVKYPQEIRKVVCRGCTREIDDMGCCIDCKYDSVNFGDRDTATVAVLVYTLNRVEPYTSFKKKHRKK